VVLARTGISEEHIASIIRLKRIGVLKATLAVTGNNMKAISFSSQHVSVASYY
jgi:hypothetical protein